MFSEGIDEMGLKNVKKHIVNNRLLYERCLLAYSKRKSNVEKALQNKVRIRLDTGLYRNELEISILNNKREKAQGEDKSNEDNLVANTICVRGNILDIFLLEAKTSKLPIADDLDSNELENYISAKKNIVFACDMYCPQLLAHECVVKLELKIKKKFNEVLRLDYYLMNLIDVETWYDKKFESLRVDKLLINGENTIKRNLMFAVATLMNEQEFSYLLFDLFFVCFLFVFTNMLFITLTKSYGIVQRLQKKKIK